MKNTAKFSQEQLDEYKKQGKVITADEVSVFELEEIPSESKATIERVFSALPITKDSVPTFQEYVRNCTRNSLQAGIKAMKGYVLIGFDPQGNSYPMLLPKDEIDLELKQMQVDPLNATDEQLLRSIFKFVRDITGLPA